MLHVLSCTSMKDDMHTYYEASKSHSHMDCAYSIVCIPTMTLYGINSFTNKHHGGCPFNVGAQN